MSRYMKYMSMTQNYAVQNLLYEVDQKETDRSEAMGNLRNSKKQVKALEQERDELKARIEDLELHMCADCWERWEDIWEVKK